MKSMKMYKSLSSSMTPKAKKELERISKDLNRKGGKCPYCGKGELIILSLDRKILVFFGRLYPQVTFTCENCGYTLSFSAEELELDIFDSDAYALIGRD